MIALATIGRYLWSFLSFGITLPLWVFLAAWLFFQFDKSQAVRDAVTDLVAGAQIEALQAQVIEERRLRAFSEGEAAALRTANQNFERKAVLAQMGQEKLADEVEELKARPAPPECRVDKPLLDRVRKQ